MIKMKLLTLDIFNEIYFLLNCNFQNHQIRQTVNIFQWENHFSILLPTSTLPKFNSNFQSLIHISGMSLNMLVDVITVMFECTIHSVLT